MSNNIVVLIALVSLIIIVGLYLVYYIAKVRQEWSLLWGKIKKESCIMIIYEYTQGYFLQEKQGCNFQENSED